MTDRTSGSAPAPSSCADLTRAGLIDDYRFLIAPMALGKGKSLFASLDAPLGLRLTGTRTFPNGSVLLEYVPADGEGTP